MTDPVAEPVDPPTESGDRPHLIARLGARTRPAPNLALAAAVIAACVPLAHAVGAVGSPGPQPVRAAADASLPVPTEPMGPVPYEPESRTAKAWVLDDARAVAILAQARTAAAAAAKAAKAAGAEDDGAADDPAQGPIPTTSTTAKTRQIISLIRKEFPDDQVGNAMAVSACESGHSDAIGAVNSDGTTDWGVFQLNDGGTLQGALRAVGVSFGSAAEAQKAALDTETNVRAAASIYADRGWAPWVCAYKIGVVSSLYGNAPGPMYGKFDRWGKPTVPMPVIDLGPAGAADADAPAAAEPTDGKPAGRPDRTVAPKRPKPHATDQATQEKEPKQKSAPGASPRPARSPSTSPSQPVEDEQPADPPAAVPPSAAPDPQPVPPPDQAPSPVTPISSQDPGAAPQASTGAVP